MQLHTYVVVVVVVNAFQNINGLTQRNVKCCHNYSSQKSLKMQKETQGSKNLNQCENV